MHQVFFLTNSLCFLLCSFMLGQCYLVTDATIKTEYGCKEEEEKSKHRPFSICTKPHHRTCKFKQWITAEIHCLGSSADTTIAVWLWSLHHTGHFRTGTQRQRSQTVIHWSLPERSIDPLIALLYRMRQRDDFIHISTWTSDSRNTPFQMNKGDIEVCVSSSKTIIKIDCFLSPVVQCAVTI